MGGSEMAGTPSHAARPRVQEAGLLADIAVLTPAGKPGFDVESACSLGVRAPAKHSRGGYCPF